MEKPKIKEFALKDPEDFFESHTLAGRVDIFTLKPYYKNFSKRLIKSPKIYFYDTGLASYILGIESKKQLLTHYLRGGLFESLIIFEVQKHFYNLGKIPRIYFWRDKIGHEIDCLVE